MGSVTLAAYFVIDTSRNGQGPLDANIYASSPYNQPTSVVQTITNGRWCNPPGVDLGRIRRPIPESRCWTLIFG